jgi:hypothetical protein
MSDTRIVKSYTVNAGVSDVAAHFPRKESEWQRYTQSGIYALCHINNELASCTDSVELNSPIFNDFIIKFMRAHKIEETEAGDWE